MRSPSDAAREGRVRPAHAVLDQPGLHLAVLDHHGVVEDAHLRHAAAGMAVVEIAAEQRILLGRGVRPIADSADEVRFARLHPAHRAAGLERVDQDTDRDAGPAALAGRPVGDVLAAAEAALAEDIEQRRRPLADEMGEHLPLRLARQIRAGRRRGEKELRRLRMMHCHGRPPSLKANNTMDQPAKMLTIRGGRAEYRPLRSLRNDSAPDPLREDWSDNRSVSRRMRWLRK